MALGAETASGKSNVSQCIICVTGDVNLSSVFDFVNIADQELVALNCTRSSSGKVQV